MKYNQMKKILFKFDLINFKNDKKLSNYRKNW